MNLSIISKQVIWLCAITVACLLHGPTTANAQLPTNFPTLTVTTNYAPAVATGYIFQSVTIAPTNVGYYAMILTNDGTPVWYKELTNACYDFKVLPNGYLHYAQQTKALTYSGGGYVTHEILDENHNSVESIHAGNGYVAEAHDFQMLPNGHVLLISYYLTQVDMSRVVPNGNPGAQVSGAVLQELDGQRNVVFQWRSWDHYPFTSQWVNSINAVISAFHINCVFQDNDGHLVISTPDWVKKINRQTGDIMWHLGGTENQFTFIGVSQQQGTNDFRSHAISRLPNGHVLLYNNSALGPGTTSTAHEYALDEVNLTATHIWTYTPNPAIQGPFQGSAQHLANNNTFVGWGGLPGVTAAACSEVAGTNLVFQMKWNNTNVISYRATRSPYPPASQANTAFALELSAGNTYSFGGTGVSLEVTSGGGGYNRVDVTRDPYAPVYPLFQGKAPRVLPVRVRLGESSISTLGATVDFNAAGFGFANPSGITVYYRATSGQGLFLPQPTVYNPATGNLSVDMSLSGSAGDLGEFIFTYPDLADLSFPPLLAQVENYRGLQPYDVIAPQLAVTGVTYPVNQARPVLLSWSPKGLASYYEFEIATNQNFANPVLQMPYQTDAFYVWNGAVPNATYFYRVRTWNDAGASSWAVGSFSTVAPFMTVTAPNGGENWRRGLKYFIQWNANISENVIIDLYKAGAFVSTIASNAPAAGAFQWQVGLNLTPGNDYSIRIRSATNSALFDMSDAPFSIDMPYIDTHSLVRFPDGRFSFGLVAPGASQATVFGSTNLQFWQPLQSIPLTNSAAVFTDTSSTNLPIRFYRLHVP
jgi:hypothetical protein